MGYIHTLVPVLVENQIQYQKDLRRDLVLNYLFEVISSAVVAVDSWSC